MRLLLIIGIAAMVISVVCFIGVSSLMQSVSERADRTQRAESVIGDLTWDEILATSSERRAQQSADASTATKAQGESSPAPSASDTGSTTPASTAPAAGASSTPGASTSATPQSTAGAGVSASPGSSASGASASQTATMNPASRPTVLIGGGLVPYDDRKFTVSLGAIPEAGYAKVINVTRQSTMRAQDITWEVDVPDSDDVHVTVAGQRLGDKDVISTGALVELYDGDKVIDTAVVVIPGDVLGTGEVDSAQITALQRALTDPAALQGAFFLAGDLDGNGKIEQADVALLRERVGGGD